MLLSSILLLLCITSVFATENSTVVFQKGEAGYFCIRIPALLTTAKGTLIAFGEARRFSCMDNTQIDIAYKRSLDNGKTWSELKIMYRGNATGDDFSYVGNMAPVQLKYNQRILVPFCRNNRLPMQTYSDDDGLTFAQPELIPNITIPEWHWFALGPPGSLLLQSNRIVVPGDHSPSGQYPTTSFVMLNDHNGQVDKWYLGGQINLGDYYPNECQAVELLPKSNTIFLNSRTNGTVRVGSYSDDGGLTFNKIKVLNTLVEPVTGCQGSTIYHQNTHQLFYSGIGVTSSRTNISLYISNDEGENWLFIKTIWSGPAAYSSLAILNDQSVAILYEAGAVGPYESLRFEIVYNATENRFL